MHRHLPLGLAHSLSWVLGGIGVAAGGLASIDVGSISAAAVAGVAIVSLVVERIASTYIKVRKQVDDAYKDSFSGQLAALKAELAGRDAKAAEDGERLLKRVNDANQKLHEERKAWQAAQLLHEEEAERLRTDLKAVTEELRQVRREYAEFRREYAELWEQYQALARGQADIPRQVVEQLSHSPDPDAGPHP